jgi:hypothetical protein
LAAARIIEPRTMLTFVHPLVRSAVVSDMGPAAIATAHREAVAHVDGRGRMWGRTGAALARLAARGEGWVVELLRSAAQRAAARGAPDVSARPCPADTKARLARFPSMAGFTRRAQAHGL